ncbi:MAG: AbrB/MazE/SpoVT family DNA-binding domain-containing protein [Nanoarchaeota archaeon]|nr:AbrB/MazE/SpoVT family DNA-binding domain-containing protein [Nanoarchaeota archaeon]MBU1320758.1 AbrB/MazE/SpoVT family DNA-binding domain-containing protein [Nanoarchaeota archaeon]MBU1597644.1 AbrB/MazE/SpoVT family DNA-binding domain-containing protein [Nanoarchaeota archaeon]MBU2442183.1 AbrB/MazE/SpoVT family DNA-binding domain-containing protein [Nanoarchaeota archaeon]
MVKSKTLNRSSTTTAVGGFTMGTVVVTRNYQITISKDIREQLDISIGEKMISNIDENGEIKIKKINKSPVEAAFGMWKRMKITGKEYEDKIRKEWGERDV